MAADFIVQRVTWIWFMHHCKPDQMLSSWFPCEIHKGNKMFLSSCIRLSNPRQTHLWCLCMLRHHNFLLGKLTPWTGWFLCVRLPPNSCTSGCWPYSLCLKMEIVMLFFTLEYLTYCRNGPWKYSEWHGLTTATPLEWNDGERKKDYIPHSAMVSDPAAHPQVPGFLPGTGLCTSPQWSPEKCNLPERSN